MTENKSESIIEVGNLKRKERKEGTNKSNNRSRRSGGEMLMTIVESNSNDQKTMSIFSDS